jgi:broad specificity phosphatase PhoE
VPVLEVRRHSIRKPGGGSQLSQEGVDLARRLGSGLGPFVRVVTSVVPRARETAIAMGFAVDHEVVTLGSDPGLYEQASTVAWGRSTQPFADLARLIADDGAYKRYAHAIAAVWRDLLTPLRDDEAVLVIGHSGELEAALVACLPHADHASWGGFFGACEGARLAFDGEPAHFNSIEFLRL